jgi:O-antigen ligase
MRRLTFILLVIGCGLSLLGWGAVLGERQMRLRGALNGLPPADLPYRVPIKGVNVHLETYDNDALAENLDLIAETGFTWVRQPFSWAEIESQPGVYNWETYDRIVEAAAGRDLRLVAVLVESPAWAADAPTAPPDDSEQFAAFAALLTRRYSHQIDVYQIWNNPNLSEGWGGRNPNPRTYADLLAVAYYAIHANDADSTVLTGGLAPTVETGPDNLSDVLYLRALYQIGADRYFDGVAGQPFGFDTGPEDRRVAHDRLNFSRLVLLREEMEAWGDTSKPLWASAFGWNALPDGWSGESSIWGQVTPDQQAQFVAQAYQRAMFEWPWSGALIVENWQPDAPPDDPSWGFALRRADGSLSPAADLIRQQVRYEDALYPGLHHPTTPLARYTGDWKLGPLGADIGWYNDSQVDVPYVGDSFGLVVRRGAYRAYLFVWVDGQPAPALPRDERGAYLSLTSPDMQPTTETIAVTNNTGDGQPHTVHIEAERSWDQWALAGFAVGHKVRTLGYDAALIGLALAAIACLVGAFRVGSRLDWEPIKAIRRLHQGLSEGAQLLLSALAAGAVWLGMILTWGGGLTQITRRLGDGPSLLITALTAGLVHFSPWLVPTLAALVVLFALIYMRPDHGLALVVFFTPFYLITRPLFDRALSMVETTVLLCVAAWMVRQIAARREKGWPSPRELWSRTTPADRATLLLVGVSVLSLLWAEIKGVAMTELRVMILEPAALYLLIRTEPLDRRQLWRLVDAFVLAGVAISVIGLYKYIAGVDVVAAEEGARRLRSIYGSPNSVGLYLGRIIPLAAAIVLMGRSKSRRTLYGLAAALMLVAVALSVSKGAILLGLPVGLGLVVILWAGRRGAIAVGVGLLVGLAALIPLSQYPRFSSVLQPTTGTAGSRLMLWWASLQLIRDHPLLGVGLDNFLYAYRGRYVLPTAWQQPDLSHVHNLVLDSWVRLGIFGLAAGVWQQIAFWKLGWRAQKCLRSDPDLRAVAIGLMGGMADFIAHGLVDNAYFAIDLAFVFYLALGLMQVLSDESM